MANITLADFIKCLKETIISKVLNDLIKFKDLQIDRMHKSMFCLTAVEDVFFDGFKEKCLSGRNMIKADDFSWTALTDHCSQAIQNDSFVTTKKCDDLNLVEVFREKKCNNLFITPNIEKIKHTLTGVLADKSLPPSPETKTASADDNIGWPQLTTLLSSTEFIIGFIVFFGMVFVGIIAKRYYSNRTSNQQKREKLVGENNYNFNFNSLAESHYLGAPAEQNALTALAEKHNFKVTILNDPSGSLTGHRVNYP